MDKEECMGTSIEMEISTKQKKKTYFYLHTRPRLIISLTTHTINCKLTNRLNIEIGSS